MPGVMEEEESTSACSSTTAGSGSDTGHQDLKFPA